MSLVSVRNVVVEFPVLGIQHRSIKRAVIRTATGGRLAHDSSNHVVIRALDDVSFDLSEGDRLGLIGHNGSGKSTLLRVLAGTYRPQLGRAIVKGRVGSMISLMLGMDHEQTGYENVRLRGTLMGFKPAEIDQMMSDIIEFADLGDYIDMPMRMYSSGMAMRLAFALATAGTVDVVLMDEWISAGDADFQVKAEQRLLNKISKAKILVLATHDESLVKRHCNKVIRLVQGRIVECR